MHRVPGSVPSKTTRKPPEWLRMDQKARKEKRRRTAGLACSGGVGMLLPSSDLGGILSSRLWAVFQREEVTQ